MDTDTTVAPWAVGQEVILRERRYQGDTEDTTVTVDRVARKYVYICGPYGRERAFSIDTGVERTGPNDNSAYAGQLFTAESLAQHDRRRAAETRVADLTRAYSWTRRLSAEDLEQIAGIIESARDQA